MASRFEKFSERARMVLSHSQEEAERLNHNYIGAEHILLGLVRETDGVAARVLSSLGVELSQVRSAVEIIIGRSERPSPGDIALTPRAKKVIELAVDEARRLTDDYVGTEHLLIGLIREGEGEAARVLESLGASQEKVRAEAKRVILEIRLQITSAFKRAVRRIELMALSEAAQAAIDEGLMAHPASVVERLITNLILYDDYIQGHPNTIASCISWGGKRGWRGKMVLLGKMVWRRKIPYVNPRPGPVVVSVRKVRELGLTDDELEAVMLHEMGHAITNERDGVDPFRDNEALVDEWMRDNGFEAEASILKDGRRGRR